MGVPLFIALTVKNKLKNPSFYSYLFFCFYQNFYEPQNNSNLSGPFPVTHIYDGDTIAVKIGSSEQKVRLVGIDTLEVADPRRPVGCFGKEASLKTKELLSGQKVLLEIDSSKNLVDKYSRLLRYVYRQSDNLFINRYLVENCYAHEYSYQNIPHRFATPFKELQVQARAKHLGLWSNNICPNVQ